MTRSIQHFPDGKGGYIGGYLTPATPGKTINIHPNRLGAVSGAVKVGQIVTYFPDGRGGYIGGLRAENVGGRCPIFLVDCTGSMDGWNRASVKIAIRNYMENTSCPHFGGGWFENTRHYSFYRSYWTHITPEVTTLFPNWVCSPRSGYDEDAVGVINKFLDSFEDDLVGSTFIVANNEGRPTTPSDAFVQKFIDLDLTLIALVQDTSTLLRLCNKLISWGYCNVKKLYLCNYNPNTFFQDLYDAGLAE